jgi:hypothetical protein
MNYKFGPSSGRRIRFGSAFPILCSLVLACLGYACEPTHVRVDLDAAERKGFSQFGEEGILERIFEIIPPTSRYAVEFGAYDGQTNSNTRNLVVQHNRGGLQIEGDPRRAAQLRELYKDNRRVTVMEAWVFPGNIELLFEEANAPKDMDLLVIDIDSNDYYVWRAIHDYRPKVVLIESNNDFTPPQRAVIAYHPFNFWDGTNYVGASMQSMVDLGKKKGYELVHVMKTGPNLIFVDAQYFARFGIQDNSATTMWRPKFQSKNPTEYAPDKNALKVDAFEIQKKWILDRY